MLPKLGTSVAKVNQKLGYGYLKKVQDRNGSLTLTQTKLGEIEQLRDKVSNDPFAKYHPPDPQYLVS